MKTLKTDTFKLPLSLRAWSTTSFKDTLKKEICSLDANLLPLQQGLEHSSIAIGENLSVIVLNSEANDKVLTVKIGLFYTGIIAGCNCADDPTPIDENNEYCEVLLTIDKHTAETDVTLLN